MSDQVNKLPVRIIRVEHIAGFFTQIEQALKQFLIKDRLTISPITSKSAAISALALCDNAFACDIDSPIDACGGGCSLSIEVIQLLTSLDGVMWVERIQKQKSSNAHARAVTQTTDIVNWAGISLEYGACGDSITCAFRDDLPFSLLKTLYPTLGTAATETDNTLRSKEKFDSQIEKLSRRATSILRKSDKSQRTSSSSRKSLLTTPLPTSTSPSINTPPFSLLDHVNLNDNKRRNGKAKSWVYPRSLLHQQKNDNRNLTQSDCTATCSGPSCGLGYASCGGLDSPLEILGLDGTGQIVQVVDSGLDFRSPFFFDSKSTVTPTNLPPTKLTSHRKVAAYWSYMDAIDKLGGHGTHVAGSVAGNAAPVSSASDSLMLNALSGMAPGATIYFTDVACQTSGGCTPPASIPSSCSVCQGSGFYTPLSIASLFQPAYNVGSRISTNSWGATLSPYYSSISVDIDSYVFSRPDHLVIFAAGNDGKDAGYASLSTQAVAKNTLTVGATRDGLLSHMMNIGGFNDVTGYINPLFGQENPNSCGGIINTAVIYGLLSSPVCESPTNDYCAQLAGDALVNPFNVPGDMRQGYLFENGAYFDLALCCGCTAKQIFDGLVGVLPSPIFSELINTFEKTYNARYPSIFTSRGPTLDGRIKPDVVAPGVDIVSARASGGAPYNTFSCASGPLYTNNSYDQTFLPYTGTGVPTVSQFGSFLIGSKLTFTEPVYIDNIQIYIDGVTDFGKIYVAIVDSQLSIVTSIISYDAEPGVSETYPFQISSTFGAGFTGYIVLMADEGLEFETLTTSTKTSFPQCFGSLNATILVGLDFSRGGPEGWIMPDSGTSMATPVTAGNAALVRSYFTDGFYPTGARNGSVGFSPSAALMKAVLINSATPTIDLDLAKLFNVSGPPQNELFSEAGFGIASLVRGLSFKTLGSVTRASGALPTLLLPGLSPTGVDPSISDDGANIYCIDTKTPSTGTGALPFSVTLVWTDPAGSTLATTALVNDLDLEVTLPGGKTVLYGNVDPKAPVQRADKLNNVEKVSVSSPPYTLSSDGKQRLTSSFRVLVRGSAVIFGPQKYSLVITGAGVSLSDTSCGGDPLVPAGSSAPATLTSSDLIVVVSVLSVILVLFVGWDAFKRFRSRPVEYSSMVSTKQQQASSLISAKEQVYGVSASNLELGSVVPKVAEWAPKR